MATLIRSEQTNQSGWSPANETWTYASADSPTFTFTVASDVTGKYSAGMRIKLTQTTVKYFIITAVSSFTGGNTTITVYGGTDYTLANASITSPFFSTHKSPQGFPMQSEKWTVETSSTSVATQTNPLLTTWYNTGSLSITVPIGYWNLGYEGCFAARGTYPSGGSATYVGGYATLSTANNSESNTKLSTYCEHDSAVYTDNRVYQSVYKSYPISTASKTVYYLNTKSVSAESANNWVGFYGTIIPTIIRAVCAYL